MENETTGPDWTTIDRFFHPTDAHIVAGRLESEGIPVYLLGINHVSANWLIANALGGIRLQVPAKFAAEARAILAERPELPEERISTCPNCESTDTSAMSNSRKIAFLAVHLFSIPIPWGRNRRHCQSCGHEWVTTKDN